MCVVELTDWTRHQSSTELVVQVSNMPNAQSKAVRRSEDNLCPTEWVALCGKPSTGARVASIDDGTRPGINLIVASH